MSSPSSSSRGHLSPLTTPEADEDLPFVDEATQQLRDEERVARAANNKTRVAEQKKQAAKKRKSNYSDSEKKEQAKQLDELLAKSAAFSKVLTQKTEILGRVGSGFDNKALGEHDLKMAKQPKIMSGGKMRDYQLEGLTWMYEICSQGMSGILADEMGLGKTIQTISLIALLREQEGYLGPHLIVAPLSTLSNWIEEFEKWTPSVPVALYHGTPQEREKIRQNKILKHLNGVRPTSKFPVVCTSYEIILRDKNALSKINWEFIIIDEGHRLKNFDSALFRELRTFTSATRLLITGTPLQNNLKELWSLLNFLMPTIFSNWEHFESWFDFSELQDEEGTEEFIADKQKQELIKKIHLILQPMLLRRIKADVEHLLPKKREYVLYAPMTPQQTELYKIMSDKNADARKFLEDKVVERLTQDFPSAPNPTNKTSPSKVKKEADESSEDEGPLKLAIRNRTRNAGATEETPSKGRGNAFDKMMSKGRGSQRSSSKSSLGKRKSMDSVSTPVSKSAKSSRTSSPAGSLRTSTRKRRGRKNLKAIDAEASEEDELSDDEFEQKLADEAAQEDLVIEDEKSPEEIRRDKILDLARKEIAVKKLGNPLMQLRLVCNSPHNFFNPWTADSELAIDETLVTHSGKMLLLDRLLPTLFERGHKVLIFSQFKTQLDLIQDYASDLRKWPVCRIDGSVAQDDRRQQIKDFNTDPDHRLFLLSTRAGGQGINLATADTVILFDSDWNPQQDLQAIDRAHRIGQTRPVVVFRFATKGTVEENLLLSADAKRRLEKLVIKKGGFKTLAEKMDSKEDLEESELRALLLKDGQVFKYSGKEEILSDKDMDILCDRSDEAYKKAAEGLGNTDSEAFMVVETKDGGLMGIGEK